MKFLRITVGAALFALPSIEAAAQSADAVLVLGNGGVTEATAFDLARDPEARAVLLGQRRVVPPEIGATEINDIKVLRDGSFLLAGVGGRGAVVTKADASRFTTVLDPQLGYPDVDSVSVATYFSPGQPSLLFVGDSATSSVSIRGAEGGEVAYYRPVSLSTSRAQVSQSIVMPDNTLAVALNWTLAGVSAVQLVSSLEVDPFATFASVDHPELPANTVLIPELAQVRDVQGLEGGNLLVTASYDVLELDFDGVIVNRLSTGDFPEINGQIASARVIESGLVALATFQPGEWVRPHTNHRVHWIDFETKELVATSEALSRAPRRVEALRGTGGTGTVGFDAGLDILQNGDPEDIELVDLMVAPNPVEVGQRLLTTAVVLNGGDSPVALSRVSIKGARGVCSAALQEDYEFAFETSVALNPMQAVALRNEQIVDARFALGAWCVYLEGLDQNGTWRRYGDPVELEIGERAEGPGSTISVTPLPFGEAPDFGPVGADAGGDGGIADDFVGKKGCCSSAAASAADGRLVLLLLFGVMAVRRLSATDRARR